MNLFAGSNFLFVGVSIFKYGDELIINRIKLLRTMYLEILYLDLYKHDIKINSPKISKYFEK